jgi:hypothetical protein
MANTIKLGNGNWATKEGSLLAYNDENNNFKPLPFTTTRASSASVVNKKGLIETVGSGIPRIDFSDNSDGALLLEGTSTNLLTYSEDFTQWQLIGTPTVNLNSIISPDGLLKGTKVTRGSNGTPIRLSTSSIIGVEHTFSVYAKKGSYDKIGIDIGDQPQLNFTLTDEWQRFQVTSTASGSNNFVDISLPISISGDSIYIYGAQLEQQSYATSYIKTVGSSQTRIADTATGSGNSTVINSSEGVLYAEMKNDIVQNQTISLRQGTTDSVQLGLINGNIRCAIVSNNSAVLDTSTFAYNNGLINKYAIVWNGTNAKTFINGQLTNTITTPSPLNLDSLDFQNPALAENIVGKIKSVQVYTTALSDAELTSLTTI